MEYGGSRRGRRRRMPLHIGLPARCCCNGLAKIESARGSTTPVIRLSTFRYAVNSNGLFSPWVLSAPGLVVRLHCSVTMLIIIVILSLNSSCES